jgi:pyrroloquinoline-quinone synthase
VSRDREAFVLRLRAVGRDRYHDKHSFHVKMHAGQLSRAQIQGWVRNRFYYQTRIPIKDALILSKSEDRAFRRLWIRRILDHDGQVNVGASPSASLPGPSGSLPGPSGSLPSEPGGIELWLRLGDGVGIPREELTSHRSVLPAVRFACDAYVEFVRHKSLLEAVASSLTELFAPELMTTRIAAWERHYPWVAADMLAYFRARVPRAPRDSDEALAYVLEHATTEEREELCVRAVETKCDILWALLDAVSLAYPDP